MTQKNHLVSVVAATYNKEKYLDQALASLEEQSFPFLEIICVNDGSTDGSPAIMRAHAAHDPRIRIIDKPNGGYGAAVNRGIDEATGDWLAILEPDDWIERGMFADLLALVDSFETQVDVAESAYWRVFERAGETLKVPCAYKGRITGPQPFAVAEQFTGVKGVMVSIEDTIKGFNAILDGEVDDLPEQAFLSVGTIEDAKAKAKKLLEAAKG